MINPNFIANDCQVEIPLSKTKLFFLLLIAIAFVIGGVFFVLRPDEFQGTGFRHRPIWIISTIGYACIIFFGAGVIIFIYQLFNHKPGLIINDRGISISPGSLSPTFFEWKLIDRFDIVSINRTKLIRIYLKKPEKYIDSLTNPLKRKIAAFGLEKYQTPISISASTLKCNTDELFALLNQKLKS